jgi:hypothetical protein
MTQRRRRTDDDDDDSPFDANGILKDGRSVRVSLLMADGASVQRPSSRTYNPDEDPFDPVTGKLKSRYRSLDHYVMGDAAMADQRPAIVHDGGGHKPGFVRPADASLRDEVERAYRERARDDAVAWRRGPPSGPSDITVTNTTSGLLVGAREGDRCTVREGYQAGYVEGAPGRLQMIDGRLVCIADPPGRTDALPTLDERACAYREYDQRMADAWRGPRSSGKW